MVSPRGRRGNRPARRRWWTSCGSSCWIPNRSELDLRQSQQEVGEIVAGAFHRLPGGVQFAGHQAAEAERAARVLEVLAVLLQAVVGVAEGKVVLALRTT